MSYSAVAVKAVNDILSAAHMNQLRSNQEHFASLKPHCRTYNSAALPIPNSTATALTFNTERYDVGGCHSTSSNTGRLTVPTGEGGKYMIGGHISWASNGTGSRQLYIRLNGATLLAVDSLMATTTGGGTEQSVTTMYALAAGDFVELVAAQGSGGSLNINAAASYSPEFWFMWQST